MNKNSVKELLVNDRKLFREYKIKNMGLFGSYLNNKNSKKSDIDLIVEFEETIDLFKYVRLIKDLQNLLKLRVDLVTKNALKPFIKDKILSEVEWIA